MLARNNNLVQGGSVQNGLITGLDSQVSFARSGQVSRCLRVPFAGLSAGRTLTMNLKYVIANRTPGANPFKIFEALKSLDAEALRFAICRMQYPEFLKSAYWFGVSTVAKSRAGMRCQVCDSGSAIQVHHRTYDTHGAEHVHMEDLTVLCGNCHGLFHGHVTVEYTPPKRVHSARKIPENLTIPHADVESQMPEGETITLTKELIDRCRANGSFTNATINAFGLTKNDIARGWTFRLVGQKLHRNAYKSALEGKHVYRARLNK